MGYSVEVKSPPGIPNVQEVVSSFAHSPGNLCYATVELGLAPLPKLSTEKQKEALVLLIQELDKGKEGVFHDKWCMKCDLTWSDGRECGRVPGSNRSNR